MIDPWSHPSLREFTYNSHMACFEWEGLLKIEDLIPIVGLGFRVLGILHPKFQGEINYKYLTLFDQINYCFNNY